MNGILLGIVLGVLVTLSLSPVSATESKSKDDGVPYLEMLMMFPTMMIPLSMESSKTYVEENFPRVVDRVKGFVEKDLPVMAEAVKERVKVMKEGVKEGVKEHVETLKEGVVAAVTAGEETLQYLTENGLSEAKVGGGGVPLRQAVELLMDTVRGCLCCRNGSRRPRRWSTR